MNVAKTLIDITEKFKDKTAINFKEAGISFSQLKARAFSLANGLNKMGLVKGSKLAVCLPNSPEYALSYLAVYMLGGIILPLDFMLIQEELQGIIGHSEARFFITTKRKDIDFKRLKQNTNLEHIIILEQEEGFLSIQNLIDENPPVLPEIQIEDQEPSTIFYTSGSTGHPKGVLLNYAHLNGPVKALEYFLPLSSQDIFLCPLPLSHAAGWVFLMFTIYSGITLILQERFLPLESLRKIDKYKVNLICLVPSMYVAILSLKEFNKFVLESLKYVIVFGAPSSAVLLRRFKKACPNASLLNGWGMTETSPPNTLSPLGTDKIDSIGKPVPWLEIKIVDHQDKEVPVGQIGELIVRSWLVMTEYYKEPELTKQVLRNGWFYTGDLARLDVQGYLYIVGRKKEMIKVAGEIVYAPEVEEVIHKHPKVREAAVVGVFDELRGEVPKAFLRLKANQMLAEEELRFFCRQHLAHFKIPHYFEFVSNLPKTRTGKIDKQALLRVTSRE